MVSELQPFEELSWINLEAPTPGQLKIVFNLLVKWQRAENIRESLIQQKGEAAQRILDTLYAWMQHSPKRHPLRRSALYLLRTLSENSSLLPSRLILPENLDPTPLVPLKPSGNSVVFQGSYDSKKIAAKQIFSYSYDKKHFYRECLTWAFLQDNARILSLTGVLTFNDPAASPMLISPWTKHGNLQEYLASGSYTPDRVSCRKLATQIAEGLTFLHINKVVHGDVKDTNIMINENGEPVIADFGLTLVGDVTYGRFTATSSRGTSGWMSPERINQGEECRDRTAAMDVWAYGLLCFMLAIGAPPWSELKVDAHKHKSDVIKEAILAGDRPSRPALFDEDKKFARLADLCTETDPKGRPTMSTVMAFFGQTLRAYMPEYPCFFLQVKKPIAPPKASTADEHKRLVRTHLKCQPGEQLAILEFEGSEPWTARKIGSDFNTVGYAPSDFSYYEDATLIRAVALKTSDKKQTPKGHLDVSQDEELDVLGADGKNWFVKNNQGCVGLVPALLLEPHWPFEDKTYQFRTFRAIFKYNPSSSTTHGLALKAGEIVDAWFRHEDSPWFVVRSHSSKLSGIVPAHFLTEVDSKS